VDKLTATTLNRLLDQLSGSEGEEAEFISKVFIKSSYFTRQFRKREKGSADFVVKALAADGSLLVTSPVMFNAPQAAKMDVTIPAEVTHRSGSEDLKRNSYADALRILRSNEIRHREVSPVRKRNKP
jgi:hypothetical protein